MISNLVMMMTMKHACSTIDMPVVHSLTNFNAETRAQCHKEPRTSSMVCRSCLSKLTSRMPSAALFWTQCKAKQIASFVY
jgi:hypothetical protein